jgi:hypothetical protein
MNGHNNKTKATNGLDNQTNKQKRNKFGFNQMAPTALPQPSRQATIKNRLLN